MMTTESIKQIAKELSAAKKERRLLGAFTALYPDFDLAAAHQVQQILFEEALASGERIIGYKMGLTSRAKQMDVGVFSSISGFLVGSSALVKGTPVDSKRFRQPRVEPEVAVVLNRTIDRPFTTMAELVSCLAFVGPAAELLDSRYENYQFKLPDVVADNTSAGAFILGTSNWVNRLDEVRLMGIKIKKNGVLIDTGAAAATFGDPLLSVVELVSELSKRGNKLEAGQVVLTGGVTAAPLLSPGDFVELIWPGETISFTYV